MHVHCTVSALISREKVHTRRDTNI